MRAVAVILEALQHLILPCPRPLKRLGVLHGLIALQNRARRCARAWAPHLAAARSIAVAGMEGVSGRELAVVCGSGLLHDVPLAELAARFERVVLIDLFHMPAARRAARRFPNVEMLAHDLSGVLEGLTGVDLPEPKAAIPFGGQADFVLSANCLSQIPLAAMDAVAGRFPEDVVEEWGRRLIAAHLDALRACSGVKVLVTDVEQQQVVAATEAVEDTADLLLGLPEPLLADRQEWWWDLAPAPEAFRTSSLRHRVVAGRVVAGRVV
ncbi:MAG: hypothetical protein VR70_06150 [Rhodospirillaceae bacterium BRH_c57]|nr:MAG: hypothetical protein VR70_06150 [Rhodospirillaceae bacterium BRH_c57]